MKKKVQWSIIDESDTFVVCLVKQADRKDVVGDLASDIASDDRVVPFESSYESLEEHMMGNFACGEDFLALEFAYEQWKQFRR